MQLPKGYEWLGKIGVLPRLVQEALQELGTTEVPGKGNNAKIMGWAATLGLPVLGYKYTGDDVPWCGLFMAYINHEAGKPIPKGPLYALNWASVGNAVPSTGPELGDILTFKRNGGGHVALYIGEDSTAYHCLGGNQGDKVCITRIEKSRLYKARRPEFKVALPISVKKYKLNGFGAISSNEA